MQLPEGAYSSYPEFLKAAIRAFWEDPETDTLDSLALLLSAREAWGVVLDKATQVAFSPRGVLSSATGVASLTVAIRTILSGPLGLVLTGASAASLMALYRRQPKRVGERSSYFRSLVTEYERRHRKVLEEADSNDQTRTEQIDALHGSLLRELKQVPVVAEISDGS